MKCKGIFVFKSVNLREGGQFTNEKGDIVKYPPAYVLKFDEETRDGIIERKLKFPEDNNVLAYKLKELEPYTKICIEFDVILYGTSVKLVPLDLVEGD